MPACRRRDTLWRALPYKRDFTDTAGPLEALPFPLALIALHRASPVERKAAL